MTKFDPRKLLALGVVFASFTLMQLSWLNLNAGYWDIFWPQLIQGLALGFLFVPLTTTTMDPIPREEMGNATSIFNLMRNLGGGMVIASVTTLLLRREQTHANKLARMSMPTACRRRRYRQNAPYLSANARCGRFHRLTHLWRSFRNG
jgi:DHA2 family multidrug resistance protein